MEIQNAQKYIYDYSGLEMHFEPWDSVPPMPLFITSNFNFYSASTDLGFILAVIPIGPVTFSKLFNTYRNLETTLHNDYKIIFILSKSSPYINKRLIEYKIAFIISGKQMFAPFLGVIYSNRSRQAYISNIPSYTTSSTKLSPSTFLVYLFLIKSGFTSKQNDIANQLRISRMTLHRAYKELMREKIIIKSDNSKKMTLPENWRTTFKDNCAKFKNPIKRLIYIDGSNHPVLSNLVFFKTSESALQELSEMADPLNESYAIYVSDWNNIKHEFTTIPHLENDSLIVEIWSIPVPSENGIVSPFALVLTMLNHKNERIKMVLENVLDQELSRYD